MAMRELIPVPSRQSGQIRRSVAQWRTLVSAFERSGETRRAFCARHGVPISTLDWWRKRLRGVGEQRLPHRPGASLFVELTQSEVPPTPPVTPNWDVELELGAGVVLRLRRNATC
jgi:putative transposase